MPPTSTPLLTPPSSIKPLPPPTWQHSNAAHAPQLLADFRTKHLPQALDAAHLTDAQREEALQWADDACLLRYLRARDYNLHHAAQMLQETFVWRVDYGTANTPAVSSTTTKDQGANAGGATAATAIEATAATAIEATAATGAAATAAGTVEASAVPGETNGAGPGSAVDHDKGAPPCGIKPSHVQNEARDGNNYVNGFDIYGRPIVYLKKRSKPRDFDANLRLLVFTLEHAISLMPDGVEQVVMIMDMSKYSRSNSPPMHISRQTLHILTSHYPERLGRAYIVNAPGVFSFLWGIVWPFLNHVTREKIRFVNVAEEGKGGKNKNEILDDVDASVLETAYGGEFEFVYDYNAYWQAA